MSEETVLNIPCAFGTVGFGKDTARIGIKVERSDLPLECADELLCGMRLTGKLTADKSDPDQMQLPGMEGSHDSVAGTFDVKSISLKPDEIGFGATFSVASVDQHALIALRSRTGRIVISSAEELPDDHDSGSSDADDHEDVGPIAKRPLKGQKAMTLSAVERLGDPGAERPLSDLIPFGMTAAKIKLVVEAVKGDTIGHLEEAMRKNEWWHRDIKGFGETWVTKLQDAHIAFRQRYPMPTDEDVEEYESCYTDAVDDFRVNPEQTNPHPANTWSYRGWAKGFDDAKNMTVDLGVTSRNGLAVDYKATGAGVQVDENTTLSVDDDDETDVDDVDNEDADELEVE